MRTHTDLVKDSKLRTAYRDGITRHVIETSDRRQGHRRIKKDQRWQRVGALLGEGAFGIVWKETLVGGESDVKDRAVKRIRKRVTNSNSLDYSRELEAIAKFSRGKYRSFFVESYGWFESQDHVFITMEYFEHGDLQRYMDKVGRMSEEDACSISYQILEGVYEMHENGFAHRDLKPSNILIRRTKDHEEGWWVKIGDFGISKRAEEGMTALRTVSGTEGFLAPEVLVRKGSLFLETAQLSKLLNKKHEYTFVVDIWAVGEIIYRTICGSSPFTTNLAAYANGKSEFPLDTLRELEISQNGIELVQQLMKVFPADRLTAREALDHLWYDEDRNGSSVSSSEFESVDENHEIPSDLLSPKHESGTSGSSFLDVSESVPWTDVDGTSQGLATLKPSIKRSSEGPLPEGVSTSILHQKAPEKVIRQSSAASSIERAGLEGVASSPASVKEEVDSSVPDDPISTPLSSLPKYYKNGAEIVCLPWKNPYGRNLVSSPASVKEEVDSSVPEDPISTSLSSLSIGGASAATISPSKEFVWLSYQPEDNKPLASLKEDQRQEITGNDSNVFTGASANTGERSSEASGVRAKTREIQDQGRETNLGDRRFVYPWNENKTPVTYHDPAESSAKSEAQHASADSKNRDLKLSQQEDEAIRYIRRANAKDGRSETTQIQSKRSTHDDRTPRKSSRSKVEKPSLTSRFLQATGLAAAPPVKAAKKRTDTPPWPRVARTRQSSDRIDQGNNHSNSQRRYRRVPKDDATEMMDSEPKDSDSEAGMRPVSPAKYRRSATTATTDDHGRSTLPSESVGSSSSGVHPVDPSQTLHVPTFIKVHEDHVDVATLKFYSIPYSVERGPPDYFVLLQEIEEKDIEILFEHTRRLRGDYVEPSGHTNPNGNESESVPRKMARRQTSFDPDQISYARKIGPEDVRWAATSGERSRDRDRYTRYQKPTVGRHTKYVL